MGCVETKQFEHTVKPVNVVVGDTNERNEASARRKKKVEEQHQRSQSAAKSISNVALQNSEKLSTATDRSRKSFMSDLMALNEINQQNAKPSTSQTPSPASHNSSPEGNYNRDEILINSPDSLPDKQHKNNYKTAKSKTVAFKEPANATDDSSMIKTTQDENGNVKQTDLTNGNATTEES